MVTENIFYQINKFTSRQFTSLLIMSKNKKAVITGATKGIGKAITIKFAGQGFK